MTERELDRTKGELVRALRRRAAELDAQEGARLATRAERRPGLGATRAVRQPNDRNAHQVAFFARHTFRYAAEAPKVPAAVGGDVRNG